MTGTDTGGRRARIGQGVIAVLAEAGIGGLTHRAVARAAGVPVAATTYYFETKASMLAEASETLLAEYIASFEKLAEAGGRAGEGLESLVARLVTNSAARYRGTSIAWCEIILYAARAPEGRLLARRWFSDLERVWCALDAAGAAPAGRKRVLVAIDIVIGMMFIVHALGLGEAEAGNLFGGTIADAGFGRGPLPDHVPLKAASRSPKAERTRADILDAAIRIMIDAGASGVSYRSIAEESGGALSAPAYHFGSIEGVVREAEARLFHSSKERYRQTLSEEASAQATTIARLADISATILIREATEFGLASLAHYSVWLEASRRPALRLVVADAIRDQADAWAKRLTPFGGGSPINGIYFQALFVGQLVKILATGSSLETLSESREIFLAAFSDCLPLPRVGHIFKS